MFKFISNFIFKKRNEKLRQYKFNIQAFFRAGYDENQQDRTDIPHLNELGITDVKLKSEILEITLLRPGLLIGLRGKTIGELRKYLSIEDKKGIKIIESKLWH